MGFLDILFPQYCVNCKRIGSYVCDSCFVFISFDTKQYCLMCGKPCFDGLTHPGCKTKYGIDGAFTSVVYAGVVKKLIYKFKYNPYLSDLRKILIELFYESIIQKEQFYVVLQEKPIIVPVPLHSSKRKARGYNQAEILGKGLAEKLNLPYAEYIERVKKTKTQVGLSKKERIENIKDAFVVKQGMKETITGRSILIVDDVITTGSTMREIGKLLKQNGVKEVFGLAFAQD